MPAIEQLRLPVDWVRNGPLAGDELEAHCTFAIFRTRFIRRFGVRKGLAFGLGVASLSSLTLNNLNPLTQNF